ncbi:MAG: Phosphomannomutase (EC / Phosphoglucomutase (EC / Phosphoglucosamine mutase (EC [uncultured Campylobacterales bacterium]|uniref:Phosphomannomutase )) n=1 Tax=uncultured Campylobacterales bacterium TaxID=352960 RepID=A0A6S6SDN4_9BACT|nr:MAG: Phosphomannomutase (EC / Phosphoglucomutase (EC / Phosphoglucosamine mutase (EC [uncultured Campylobacterales bacterium]
MTKTIFREYDIRGIYEKELNETSVKLIGYYLGQEVKKHGEYVVIGYDARTHSPKLFEYLCSGFNKANVKVINIGMVATPTNYFANFIDFGYKVGGSVMITGSHNPPEYNGFKITINKLPFFGDDIYALGDKIVDNTHIEILDNINYTSVDMKSKYIDYIVDKFSYLKNLDTKIVIDCGNGVAGTAILDIFDRLNLNYKAMYETPDGTFPNHHPDPSVEENLIDVKDELSKGYDVAFAYDGDADRIAVLTQKNNIKGDILAVLYSSQIKNPTVIGEVKCSLVMYDEIDKVGKSIMYKTGHSNLKVKMKETGADLAAEVSGHIFFKENYGFDDALYATMKVLELLYKKIDLDQQIAKLPLIYNTEEIKVKTTEEEKFSLMDKIELELKENTLDIKDIIKVDGLRVVFENGWALVRASNTTPVLVTRFESTNEKDLKFYEESLNDIISKAKSR